MYRKQTQENKEKLSGLAEKKKEEVFQGKD